MKVVCENVGVTPESQAPSLPAFAQLGGSIGHGVYEICSVAALVLVGPPGTLSTAHLHPDSSHEATTLMPEVTICSAFGTLYLAKKRESIWSPQP